MKKSIKSLYDTKNKDVVPNCHLLIDPEDHEACLTLVLLLRKCGSKIPPKLPEIIKSRTTAIENAPLCQKIKLSGYCNPLKSKCNLRHHFNNFGPQNNKNTHEILETKKRSKNGRNIYEIGIKLVPGHRYGLPGRASRRD